MTIPLILGQPPHIWGGFALLLLVLFQVLTGSRIIKPSFVWHRKMGVAILVIALIHATFAAGVRAGWILLR